MNEEGFKFDVSGDPELSATIQGVLFDLGFTWLGGDDTEALYVNNQYLYVYTESNYITYGDATQYFMKHRCIEIPVKQLKEEIYNENRR